MIDRLAADAVVAMHVAFVLFACLGGLLAWRRPRWAFVHLPAAMWAAWVEVTATICPLTPLENALRRRAGEAGYPGGFVEHYVFGLLYPEGLTRNLQLGLGLLVIVVNVIVYAWIWRRHRGATRPSD